MSQLEDIVAFLAEYQWIFKHSNTKFIKAGVLDDLSQHWAESLMILSHGEFNDIPFGQIPPCLNLNLKDFLLTISKLTVTLPTAIEDLSQLKPIRGINPKKLQEISSLSRQIHKVCSMKGIEYLVDLGSGLGYLCQMLHERYGYKILGIECDAMRVKTAQQRQEKFYTKSGKHVKYVRHFIGPSSWNFIVEELQRAFEVDPNNIPIALVGLHACGDLTVTSMEIFQANEAVQAAIVMPCCYHKMSMDGDKPLNFPLSKRLLGIFEKIPTGRGIACRPFLRLACQQPASRWKRMTEEEHIRHGTNMFHRAILDVLTDEGQEIQRKKKCCGERSSNKGFDGTRCDFEIREGTKIISWNSEHRLMWESVCKKYPRGGELAECLTLLQTTIQELCENVILLDRKLYVEEASTRFSCNLIKILDADTSPRCIVLIALKENEAS